MPAEQPNEALTQIETEKEPKTETAAKRGDAAVQLRRKWTPTTAEYGVEVTKVRKKDGLFGVHPLENKNVRYMVDLKAKTCTCPDFTEQGKCPHIEVVENIGEIRRQKHGEYTREYWRERYHSDPEAREKKLETCRKQRLTLREDYERFKIEYGGKCTFNGCEVHDLDMLEPHHPDGRREKGRNFILTKEFTLWRKYGIKPDVVLMCANHHRKLHTTEARRDGVCSP